MNDASSCSSSSSSEDEETKQQIARVREQAYARRAERQQWAEAGRRLAEHGWCTIEDFVGASELQLLRAQARALYASEQGPFTLGRTGGGKGGSGQKFSTEEVRGDRIAVLDSEDSRVPALSDLMHACDRCVAALAAGCAGLRRVLRRSKPILACYPGDGARYIKHLDNAGSNSRLLTVLVYLNEGWAAEDGGCLRLFHDDGSTTDVEPRFNRLVCFWSDARTPHEVRPCHRERWAVSLWYHDDEDEEQQEQQEQPGAGASMSFGGGDDAAASQGGDAISAYLRAAAALAADVPQWQRDQQLRWEQMHAAGGTGDGAAP
jgi:hypoxia-inducible factor (prolyl hydroxylase)